MAPGLLALLIAAVIGGAAAPSDHERLVRDREPAVEVCPAWFEETPKLGPGRPRPVSIAGLDSLIVCRYLHAFSGDEAVHEPPLQTNLAREITVRPVARVRELARSINSLEPYLHPREERQLCGRSVSGGFFMLFGYRGARQVSVKLVVTGCRWALAGKHGKVLHVSNELRRTLGELTSPAERAR